MSAPSEPASDLLPPAFILSCERSGSTLLRYVVDTHPDVCSPGQLYLGQLCAYLDRTIHLSLGQVYPTADEAERRRYVSGEVARILSDLMRSYTKAKGKRMWCEKTTTNLQYLEFLTAVFPDARYVCLYRNCMDVVYSSIECNRLGFMPELAPYVQRNPRNLVSAMVDSWLEKTGRLLEFEQQNPERCFRVKYESLVLDPAGTLGPLFAFLGVGWDPALLDAVFRVKHDPGDGDIRVKFSKSIDSTSLGKGSTIARSTIPPDQLEKMNAMLARLEYPEVGPDWGAAPSPFLPAGGGDAGTDAPSGVRELFTDYFPRLIAERRDRLPELGGAFKFVVTGPGGGVWLIDPARPDDPVAEREGEAVCTIRISSADLLDVVGGKINAAAAWDQGRLTVTGKGDAALLVAQILLGA